MSAMIDLGELGGSGRWYRPQPLLFPKFVMSDCARCLAIELDVFWLFEAIARHQMRPEIWRNPKLRKFQRWDFEVAEDDSATLEVRLRKDEKAAYTQKFEFVDLPFKSFSFFVVVGTLGVPKSTSAVFQYCCIYHQRIKEIW